MLKDRFKDIRELKCETCDATAKFDNLCSVSFVDAFRRLQTCGCEKNG